jgi:hypothetical protein
MELKTSCDVLLLEGASRGRLVSGDWSMIVVVVEEKKGRGNRRRASRRPNFSWGPGTTILRPLISINHIFLL